MVEPVEPVGPVGPVGHRQLGRGGREDDQKVLHTSLKLSKNIKFLKSVFLFSTQLGLTPCPQATKHEYQP